EALGAIRSEAAVPALVEAIKDRKDDRVTDIPVRPRTRVHAAEALWRINKHPAAVPALVAAINDPTDQADSYAHFALRRIGAEARAALPTLTEALKDSAVLVRVEAAVTLWQINKDPAVVP